MNENIDEAIKSLEGVRATLMDIPAEAHIDSAVNRLKRIKANTEAAELQAEAAKKRRELIEVRAQRKKQVEGLEKQLKNVGDLLKEERERNAAVETELTTRVTQAHGEIDALKKKLNESLEARDKLLQDRDQCKSEMLKAKEYAENVKKDLIRSEQDRVKMAGQLDECRSYLHEAQQKIISLQEAAAGDA